ncbi:ricin-type beta-trefoil lectin domain protein [Streptomyces sp. NPDC002701]|uniref:ricin-type beta-trefoil lectin domain protein n=1 Tax=Streptomyces sp. NPDC002701 TaxID=3364661 RepID=UPI0036A3AD23
MSDQQQASGESSGREAAAATPDAEAVAARPTGTGNGTGKPQTASEPEGNDAETAGAGGPEAGSGASTAAPGAASGADDPDKAPVGEETGKAGEAQSAGATAEEPDSGDAKAGENEKGAAEGAPGEGAADTNGARALSAAATREQHVAVATAVAGKGGTGAGVSGVGRPRKPVLAGAALAGALLVAVPLLITATDKDEDKKNVDTAASDTVLNKADDPAGVFATQAPSPTKTKPEKKKSAKEEPAPPVAEKAAVPTPAPSPSPSRTKKKAAAKKAPSTLPSVLTRVLIKNNTNHTCVDVPGFTSGRADGPVTHATCNSNTDDNQLWNVEKRYDKAGPGGVPLYQIRNVMDSMCLDLPGYQAVGGATKVTEFPCNGTTADNQLWWLDKQADGKFWIRNAASNNQCLDSYGPNDETRGLIVWPCAPENQNNHEWIFTRS